MIRCLNFLLDLVIQEIETLILWDAYGSLNDATLGRQC